jgi:hypothetical protein
MSVYPRKCRRKECAGKKCRHEQAEIKIRRDIFDGKYEIAASGKEKLKGFIEQDYLPWAKTNKLSFKNDDSRSKMVIERFGAKSFREITPE